MEKYDDNYEQYCLKTLAEKYPYFSNKDWKFTFWSEEEKSEFSCGEWKGGNNIFEELKIGNFYVDFICMLNDFIKRRGAHEVTPNKEGAVTFGNGKFELEWV